MGDTPRNDATQHLINKPKEVNASGTPNGEQSRLSLVEIVGKDSLAKTKDTMIAMSDDQSRRRKLNRNDGIVENPAGKVEDAQRFKSQERHPGTIIAAQNDLSQVDKDRKINLTGDLRPRNAHVIVNADGSWSFNRNNPLEAADKYQCQIWPDDSLKSKPDLFHKALVDIQKEYKAQGIDIQIPDATNKTALDALFTVAPPPPQQPNERDDDDDEDGPRPHPRPKPDDKPVTPPVTPPTPQVNPVAGLDSVTKVLMGEPITVMDPQTNQPKQVTYSMNQYTPTYFASADLPKPIGDILRSGADADTMCTQLRTLSQQYPADYTGGLTTGVNRLTSAMANAPYSDTRDAGILTNYFVTQLSNPDANKAFIANLANAMQKHEKQTLTPEDLKTFPADLRRAIANCAAISANSSFNANLTVENPASEQDAKARGALRENLIYSPYTFGLPSRSGS